MGVQESGVFMVVLLEKVVSNLNSPRMCAHMRMHVHVRVLACVFLYVCAHMRMHVHMCVLVCVFLYVCVDTCMCVQVCMYAYVCMCAYVFLYVCVHVHVIDSSIAGVVPITSIRC